MPIYEFACKQCQTQFEQLCRIDWQGTVICPSCGSVDLVKAVSAFASPGGGSRCASCAGKNCGSCK